MKWLILFLASMAMLFGTISFITYSKSAKLVSEGATTTGTVVKVEYYPIVHFRTESGEDFEEKSNFHSSPPEFKEGQTVEIVYERKNPKNWVVNNWLHLYFLPTMFAIASGGLIFATTCVSIYRMRKLRSIGPIQ